MTKIKETVQQKTAPELPAAFHSITALLHTMRCIAQHEDRLCLLRNEIKRARTVGPRLMKELHALLEELPAEEYTSDLQAVEAALSSAVPASATRKSATRKPPARQQRKPKPASQPA